MSTTIQIHHIDAASARQEQLQSGSFWTSIYARNDKGEVVEFCMFSAKPLLIVGAAEFVAQPEQVAA